MSTRGRVSAAMVSHQVPVDHVGELPLERAAGLLGRLGLAQLALVVDLAWAGVADLADRDEVQGSVELPVASPVQPMAAHIPAGGFDGGGAGIAGEVVTVGKTGEVADVPQDLGGKHRAEPEHLCQGRAAGGDRLADRLGRCGDPLVQAAHVSQQLAGDPLALTVDTGDRAQPAEQRRGPLGGQVPLGAARVQVAEQDVEPAQGAGALGDQVVAAVAEQPQRRRVVLDGDLAQAAMRQRDPATEAASVRSVLRALPVPRSRARAASLAGTSTTTWPAPTSCCATVCPSPVAPSTAHRRVDHGPTQASSWATAWSVMATRRLPSGWLWASSATAVTDRL